MLNYILSLEKAINRVPLGMELIGLQGLPLWDTRHKEGARPKVSACRHGCSPRGLNAQRPFGYSDIRLLNNRRDLEA